MAYKQVFVLMSEVQMFCSSANLHVILAHFFVIDFKAHAKEILDV